jgi:hypothetical protein
MAMPTSPRSANEDRTPTNSPPPSNGPSSGGGGGTTTNSLPVRETFGQLREQLEALLDAGGEGESVLTTTSQSLEEMLTRTDAWAEEDFRLLHTLSVKVATTCEDDLLETLVPAKDGSGAAAYEALAKALERTEGEGGKESVGGGDASDLRARYARVRRMVLKKVLALADLHSACRADRMKLLGDLVTASRFGSTSVE